MKLIFALLLLLLCGTAGAHVMARQQAEKCELKIMCQQAIIDNLRWELDRQQAERDASYDDFRAYSPSPEDRIATLESRLDSLEAKLGRAHFEPEVKK